MLSTKMGLSASMRFRACAGGMKSLTVWKGWLKAKAKAFFLGRWPICDPAYETWDAGAMVGVDVMGADCEWWCWR